MRQVVNLETGEITFEEDAPVTPQTTEEIQLQINADALAYLASTDWYNDRFLDTGIPMPEDIKVLRQEARNAIV